MRLAGRWSGLTCLILAALLAGAPATAQTPSASTTPVAPGPVGSPQPSREPGPRALAMGFTIMAARSREAYDQVVEDLGRAPAIWSFWADWGDLGEDGCPGARSTPLPDMALLTHMREQGTVPLIIWQPVDSTRQDEPLYTYEKIAEGRFDCYLRWFAEGVAAIEGPVLLRFAHEFDGYWFPWGMGRFTNTPETFVPAWQHIWEIYRGAEGLAPNARFLWSPIGCRCPEKMEALFPGTEYVDYMGLTTFNWASFHTDKDGEPVPWRRLAEILDSRLVGFEGLPDVPIIITELGSHYRGGNKATWIRNGYRALLRRYPQVVGALYFNVDMTVLDDPKHPENWLLTMPRDGSALEAYRELLTDPRFQGTIE